MEGQADRYFELKFSGREVLLRVRPPEDGGRANLGDIQKALSQQAVPYRHETLFDIFKRASDEFEVIATQELRHFDVRVEVAEDAQRAWITVTPPDRGDDTLTPQTIKSALEAAKVEKGIRYDVIKDLLARQGAVERVVVAEGKLRRNGTDGRVVLEEKVRDNLWVGENTADYRELNLIDNVQDGDLIATIVLPTRGEDGFNVHAQVLRARPGKHARYKLGRNVRLSDSGTEVFAARDGYVVRSGRKLSVEDVLDLNNVDAETGNIRFHGVVRVRGQVEDNYTVEAGKGIEVGGTVGKAELRSKGDIRVRGGSFGATLVCDGTVNVRFLSECTIHAGHDVVVDEYVLHSEIVAGRAIKVTREPKGFINGGRTRAGGEIWTPVAGSDVSEQPTLLQVGSGGIDARKRYDALQQRIEASLESFEKLRKNLAYLQQQRMREGPLDGRAKESYTQFVATGHKLRDELLRQAVATHELGQVLADPEETAGMVLVSQALHPGVTVQIQTNRVHLRDTMERCAFMLMSGSLKAMPYGAALKLHKQQQAQRARANR